MSWSTRTWSVRARQSLLTAALVTPVFIAIASTPPFAAEPRAQAGSGLLGPAFPIVAGSVRITPIRVGNTVYYPNDWSCGEVATYRVTLTNPDGTGRFRTMTRQLGSMHQDLTITALSDSGAPQQFVLTESRDAIPVYTTTANMVDLNADGVMDSITFNGQYNATISLVYSGDRVSIPWSEASTLDIDTNYACGGALPQVWFPLADTNGDGRGDAVVLDLDGNGVPDGDIYAGPMVAAASVPAMGPLARLILMLAIGLIGGWYLSRHRPDTSGTPA